MEVTFSSPWGFLEAAGFEVVQPVIDGYRIADYRPGHSGQQIQSIGVVDPDRVVGINRDPSDGVVEILLRQRGLDEVTATLDGRVGEIIGREPHSYQADGSSWDGEWLKVRFRDFDSGWLTIERLTRTGSTRATALAYHVVEPVLIVGPIEGMTVTVGDPVGTGTVALPGGTFGGVSMEGGSVPFLVPTHEQAGITADIHDLASNGTTVTTRSVDPMIEIGIDLSFETSGAEVEGTFLDYVPCWTCASFRVPQAQCSGVNIPCFLGALGALGASLGSCVDPGNWEEGQMADGPAIPFQADLTDPSLEIRILLAADPTSGAFTVKQVVPTFEAGVSLRTQNDDLQLTAIQDWVMGEVDRKLLQAMTELDLGAKVVSSLELARSNLGWGRLRGLWVLGDGRWFLDAGY